MDRVKVRATHTQYVVAWLGMKRFQEKNAPYIIKYEALNLHGPPWRETERIPMDLHKSSHRIRTNKNIKKNFWPHLAFYCMCSSMRTS